MDAQNHIKSNTDGSRIGLQNAYVVTDERDKLENIGGLTFQFYELPVTSTPRSLRSAMSGSTWRN